MSRFLYFSACLSLVMLSTVLPLAANELPSQDGLPPELVIAPEPPLLEQLALLQKALDRADEWRSESDGFVGGVKDFLSGTSVKPINVTPELLAANMDAAKGRLVGVCGLYRKIEGEEGEFRFFDGALPITIPDSLSVEGFGTSDVDGLPVRIEGVVEGQVGTARLRASRVTPCLHLVLLRVARIHEISGELNQSRDEYREAMEMYKKAADEARRVNSEFAAFARYSAGRVSYDIFRDRKKSQKKLSMAWTEYASPAPDGSTYMVWRPLADGSGWEHVTAATAIGDPLDTINRAGFWYKFMDFFVGLAGGVHWLGIVLMALVTRMLIWPLSKKQFQSAESMKRLQPQIKALQDKHVDDKQKFQQEFWKLCQANGVNPLGGCLPMLVQMPILIMLYHGIRDYIVQFQGHGFIWVGNLAHPDTVLLIMYTISMIFFQKMTQKLQPTPMMSAQQQQQQMMMTYLMPVMFFFFFRSFPAAFLLYWLATNVIYFVQQFYYQKIIVARQQTTQEANSGQPGKNSGFADAMVKMLSAQTGKDAAEENKESDEKKADEVASESSAEAAAGEQEKPRPARRSKRKR